MYKGILVLMLGLMNAAGLSRLDALSMIESGNNDFAVGGAGEISRYQIKPKIWRNYTPSREYQDQQLSGWVAGQYLASLQDSFEKRAGRAATDFDVYVLWNAGLSYYARIGFTTSRVASVIRERAERFVNLCQASSQAAPAKKDSSMRLQAAVRR